MIMGRGCHCFDEVPFVSRMLGVAFLLLYYVLENIILDQLTCVKL